MTPCRRSLTGLLIVSALSCSSINEPAPVAFEGTLAPVGTSTLEGSVGAIAHIDRTQTSISVRQAQPGVTYSWSIHRGTCASRGDLQGGAAVYPSLSAGEDGMASANAILSVLFDRGLDYAAWVEREDGDGTEVVACGELEEV